MRFSLMTYTFAFQAPGAKPDMLQVCKAAQRLGLDAMDQVRLYDYPAAEIRRMADDHGIQVICYTQPVDLGLPAGAGRQEALEEFRRVLDIALVLGAPRVMVPIKGVADLDRLTVRANAIEALKTALPLARAAGLNLLLEHFANPAGPFVRAQELDLAIKAVPGLKVAFDCGNCFTGGDDPVEAYQLHLPDIDFVHFKDWTISPDSGPGLRGLSGKRHKGALIGEGVINFPALVKAMKNSGYQGHVNLEYEDRKYSPEEGCRRAMDYLRQIEAA